MSVEQGKATQVLRLGLHAWHVEGTMIPFLRAYKEVADLVLSLWICVREAYIIIACAPARAGRAQSRTTMAHSACIRQTISGESRCLNVGGLPILDLVPRCYSPKL
jgi:hypothetical protein